jgi:hypothetical protein
MIRRTLELLLLTTMTTAGAMGQINCSSGASAQKLVCEFPFAAGVFKNDTALGGTLNGIKNAELEAGFFNSAIAAQVSQLPLASASAGTVVRYNKQSIPETFNNLGPILTDRAETVGKHRLFLGFTASQFVFTDIDGLSLGKLPFAYAATAFKPGTNTVLSTTYTTTNTDLNFRIDQFIAVATYGVTDKLDVTVIVPSERVSLGAATINSNSYIVNSSNQLVYSYANPALYSPGTASGIGDITFNVKSEIWRGERATFSGAVNVRAATGDDQNYLGSGAWGVSPYLVYSYLARISPHAKIGYQWNTNTELNFQINPTTNVGSNHALPGGLQYDVGADYAATRTLTFAADLLGSQYLNTPELSRSTTTLQTTNLGNITLPSTSPVTASYSISNISAGLKWGPWRNLVFSGNVLFQLNNNGLRSRPTPLVGLAYKF